MTDDFTRDIAGLVASVVELDPKKGMTDAIRLLLAELSPEAVIRTAHALQVLLADKRATYEWVALTALREFAAQKFSEEAIAGLEGWLLTARGLQRRNRRTGHTVFLGEALSVEDCLLEREGLVIVRQTIRMSEGSGWLPQDPGQMDLLRQWIAPL